MQCYSGSSRKLVSTKSVTTQTKTRRISGSSGSHLIHVVFIALCCNIPEEGMEVQVAVFGERVQGKTDLSSCLCAILKPLWQWASLHKGNRNMEIRWASASVQAIASWEGVQLQFDILQDLTQLHTHRRPKGAWRYDTGPAGDLSPSGLPAGARISQMSPDIPQGILNVSRHLHLGIWIEPIVSMNS